MKVETLRRTLGDGSFVGSSLPEFVRHVDQCRNSVVAIRNPENFNECRSVQIQVKTLMSSTDFDDGVFDEVRETIIAESITSLAPGCLSFF